MLKETAKEVRKKILKMIYDSQFSHIGSALSCSDIMTVLYFKILSVDPENPTKEDRDRFILSKGHACTALYAVLAQRGFLPQEILDSYSKDGSKIFGHSTMNSSFGIETSTGSLGHGLPIGNGMALAGNRAFVLMGDGECDEGSVWEAALFASHHKLDNLTAIIDYNKIQAFGDTNKVLNLEPLRDKWISFGWAVKEIDGHNLEEIEETLKNLPFEEGKPNLVIAHTIKGKGVSFMENKLAWHYKSPTKEQYEQALNEL